MLIEGFLEAGLILLHTVFAQTVVIVLLLLLDALSKHVVLHEGLFQHLAEAHALVRESLRFVLILPMLAHLDVLLELFDLAVLRLALEFHLSILALQLLHKERLEVVGLLADRCVGSRVQVIRLLLKSARQVLDLFLLLLQVDVHLLDLGAEASVFIARDVVLNLYVPVQVPHLFFLSLPEDRRLVGFDDVAAGVELAIVVGSAASPGCHLTYGHVAAAAEEDVARAVVVDNLLVDTASFLAAGAYGASSSTLHACVHGLDGHLVEQGATIAGASGWRADGAVHQLTEGISGIAAGRCGQVRVTRVDELSSELVLRERAWLGVLEGSGGELLVEGLLGGAFADATLRIGNASSWLVLCQGSPMALGTIERVCTRRTEVVRMHPPLVLLTV